MGIDQRIIQEMLRMNEEVAATCHERFEEAKTMNPEQLYVWAAEDLGAQIAPDPKNEVIMHRMFKEKPGTKELYQANYKWFLSKGFTPDRAKILADIIFISLAYKNLGGED